MPGVDAAPVGRTFEPLGDIGDLRLLPRHYTLPLESELTAYVNGMGIAGIERTNKVHHTTVIHWVKQVAKQLPDAPPWEEIPEITQVDELQTFVHSKKQCLAVDSRESGNFRNFSLGRR